MPEVSALETLLKTSSLVWRGRGAEAVPTISSGYEAIDLALPGGGWPLGVVNELVPLADGIGELSLVLPALQRAAAEPPIVLVSPPSIPLAPSLHRAGLPLKRLVWVEAADDEDARWAAEQILREGVAAAALIWTSAQGDLPLRRLQLAAQGQSTLAFVYRPAATLRYPSPSAVRLALHPAAGALRIQVLRARGGRDGASILCPLHGRA